MKNLTFAFALLFAIATASAQDWAKARLEKSSRHGEWVEFKSGERNLKAFVVYPEKKEKAAVVIVIHEIFGLTDWVRGVCDQLAENGVIAIAPDLLSGQTYADIDGARKAISALPKEQVKADLDATSDYALTKIPSANGSLGVCGFCWGGGWTFSYARVNATIPKAEELMKAAGKKYEPVIYKGAGHGFMRDGESPTGTPENKKARDDAWERWKTLLKQLP